MTDHIVDANKMVFTDEDLTRLEAMIHDVMRCDREIFFLVEALLARLEAAEEIAQAYDLGHPGDENCGCSMCDVLAAWRKAAGK